MRRAIKRKFPVRCYGQHNILVIVLTWQLCAVCWNSLWT